MRKVCLIILAVMMCFATVAQAIEYDFMLVLDTSGSMRDTPISVLQQASENLINDIYYQSPGSELAIIEYNNGARVLQDFVPMSQRSGMLRIVNGLYAGGLTYMNTALSTAQSTAQKQWKSLTNMGHTNNTRRICVIMMGDGYPEGCDVDAVYAAADKIHGYNYIDVYTVGFFHSMSSAERKRCEDVMRYIASDHTKFFTVDNATDFGIIFADMSDIILDSQKIIIWVDCLGNCPVDISVTLNGETLDKNNTHTSFGTLQFEGANNERKMLRLVPDADYSINMKGTGNGYMDYTIKYPDAQGNYTDTRKIVGIPVTRSMTATSSTQKTWQTVVTASTNGVKTTYTASSGERRIYNDHYLPISAYSSGLAVTASSYFEKNNPPVWPSRIIDGDRTTSWDAWGEHEGAWVQLSATDGYEYRMSGLTLNNGKGTTKKNAHYYDRNSRAKGLSVYIDGVYIASYVLEDHPNTQTIVFPNPIIGSSMRLVVDSVYRGSYYKDKDYGVCIAELMLW